MIKTANLVVTFSLIFLMFTVTSCGTKKQAKEEAKSNASSAKSAVPVQAAPQTAQLPVRYQTPGYVTTNMAEDDGLGDSGNEYQIKVGATIRSTGGPQPLWEVIKRLVNLKGMTVSWANDVDQSIPVDVDISASDNFYDAIASLLLQADYFHEVNGKNIIIRNKTTKLYQVGIPSMQGAYTSTVGGNFLSNKDAASGTEGTVKVTSAENKFNVWENIESNLKIILQTIEAERRESVESISMSDPGIKNQGENGTSGKADVTGTDAAPSRIESIKRSNNTARDGSSFVIDKSVGLVTVTAKPSTLKAVDSYIDNLKKHLYRQVNIEAKIIEVFLQDNSKIGLDWSSVLKDKSIVATTSFGNAGQVYPYTTPGSDLFANTFISRVTIPSISFEVLLSALNEQGESHVLANPKLTVLNGQPAIISVGKDIAYVKQVTAEVDNDSTNATTTYSAEVGNVVQGIALGVMATIRDNNTVVLHLTPITTDLENLSPDGNIPVTTVGVGPGAVQLGLPQVKVREMSTMVEVEDGEMLVIGGLIDSVEGNSAAFAPGLGNIPVIKYLFGVEEKTMQKRELVILLTPKII